MPYYVYEAKEKTGRLVKRNVSAANKQELTTNLQKMGMVILSIKESTQSAVKVKTKMHKRATQKDLVLFAKAFSILLESGVVVIDALDVVITQTESIDLQNAIKAIKKDLEGGSTLRDAIAKHPKIFSDFWRDMADAGEMSGQMPFVMRQIVAFLESGEAIRTKAINALIYPVVLFGFAVLAVFVFVFKIVPIFQDLFSSLGSRLPRFTEIIIAISQALRSYFPIFLGVVIIAVIIFRKIVATKQGRRAFEAFLLGIPTIGGLISAISIEKFASTLGVLLKSGIPIVRAMEAASRTSESMIFAEKIEEAKTKVMAGSPLSEALQQTDLFPPLVVQLITVGEKTGNFSDMLEEIAKFYKDVIDVGVVRFTSLFEPVVIMFMAVVVGSLLVGMFLPIFRLAAAGGGG